MTKVCTRCEIEKGLDEFYKDSRGLHGRYAKCKPCHLEVARISDKRPEAKAKRRSRQLQRRDDQNARRRARWAEDPERYRVYHARWQRAHPEKVAEANHRRRARLLAAEGSYSAQEWTTLCERYGNRCLACGSEDVTVDHVVPLSLGGSNYIENIQPLCLRCNSAKGTQTIDYRASCSGMTKPRDRVRA